MCPGCGGCVTEPRRTEPVAGQCLAASLVDTCHVFGCCRYLCDPGQDRIKVYGEASDRVKRLISSQTLHLRIVVNLGIHRLEN